MDASLGDSSKSQRLWESCYISYTQSGRTLSHRPSVGNVKIAVFDLLHSRGLCALYGFKFQETEERRPIEELPLNFSVGKHGS